MWKSILSVTKRFDIRQLQSYGAYFQPGLIGNVVLRLRKRSGYARKALALYYCFRDERTPRHVKAIIVGALGYLLAPIDLIPDTIPFAGLVDDAVVVGIAMAVAQRYLTREHWEKAMTFFAFGEHRLQAEGATRDSLHEGEK